jgi:hemolysin III
MYHGEKLNSITHLVGSAMALAGLGALLTVSIPQRDPWMIVSFAIFGGTLVLLYTVSTLYHSFHPPRLKALFQKMDHVSIYLLIAGTYTPFMLVSLRNGAGPAMLTAVWALAALGIFLEFYGKRRIQILQVSIYILMGWVAVLQYRQLGEALGNQGLAWLTVGGVAYTLGIIFYALDHNNKLRHAHGIWHLFVLAGSVCHFISVIGFVR